MQRAILDALPALVFLERAGWIVFANAEALQVMGMPAGAWEPRPIEDVLWGLFPGVAEPQTALAAGRGSSPFHATLAARDGRILPVEGTYAILNAELREGIVVAHVSTRERAPKPRLMEDVLASVPEAVAMVHGGRVLYTNPSFTRMFGYSAEEAVGRNLRDLIVPETRQHENAMLQRAMEDEGRVSMDTVRLNKAGELLDVAMQVAPLLVNGQPAGYVLTYRDIGERKQVEHKIQQDALYDILTGLPNRVLLEDRLKLALSRRARRCDLNCGLLFLDFERFSSVNETLGHAAGDMLLMSAAGRLRATLRPQDTAARLGGDRFAVLVEGIVTLADLEVVAQRVMREMSQVFDLLGHRIHVPVSMGVAIAEDAHDTPEALFHDADRAMHRARQSGGGRYEIFDRGSDIEISNDKLRERQLRQVLDQHQFELWYQPIYRLSSAALEGFEALPRLRRPDGSVDSLRDLLPVAEDAGFSINMGRELIEMTCRQLKDWGNVFAGSPPFLSIDLTRRQFFQDNLIAQVQMILMEAGIAPSRLFFEISEGIVSDNQDRAVAILQRLVDCGVRVALDHFGSGLAPLNHLVRLPVEMVKLDPNLSLGAMQPGRHLALLQSLIHVAKSAGVQVLAQGIQTQEQLNVLQELGCDLGQGHFLSLAVEPPRALEMAAKANSSKLTLKA